MSSSSPYKVYKCANVSCEAEYTIVPFKASAYQQHVSRCPYCGKQDVMVIECITFNLYDAAPVKMEVSGKLQRPEWPDVQDGTRVGSENANELRER